MIVCMSKVVCQATALKHSGRRLDSKQFAPRKIEVLHYCRQGQMMLFKQTVCGVMISENKTTFRPEILLVMQRSIAATPYSTLCQRCPCCFLGSFAADAVGAASSAGAGAAAAFLALSLCCFARCGRSFSGESSKPRNSKEWSSCRRAVRRQSIKNSFREMNTFVSLQLQLILTSAGSHPCSTVSPNHSGASSSRLGNLDPALLSGPMGPLQLGNGRVKYDSRIDSSGHFIRL